MTEPLLTALQKQYIPHRGQRLFHESPARFRLLVTGRRFGKTLAGAHETWMVAKDNPGEVILVVAPTFSQLKEINMPALRRMIPDTCIKKVNMSDMYILLENDTKIILKSAENYDSMRGFGPVFDWCDEAGYFRENVWYEVLEPGLMDRSGEAIFTTTPKGLNWLKKLYDKGMDPVETDYESMNFLSSDNPYLDKSWIEKKQGTTAPDIFRQEYLGEFVDNTGDVFKDIDRVIMGDYIDEPALSDKYIMGVDLAKHEDYTVIVVLRERDNHIVGFDRPEHLLNWKLQVELIEGKAKKFNNAIIELDATGVGDVVLDMLRSKRVRVNPHKFTNETKAELIQNLQTVIEHRKVTFPRNPILEDELLMFRKKQLPSGRIQYSAPDGYHDDCVIALALACSGIHPGRVGKPRPPKAFTQETVKPKVTEHMTRRERGRLEQTKRMIW